MNKIEINFTPCEPAPAGGYNVKWWIAGSDAMPINAGNFFVSPAIFYDNSNPAGTQYEGFIKSECGGDTNQIYWATVDGCGESEIEEPLTGVVAFTARTVFVSISESIPCDVTFPIDGFYDDFGTDTPFTAFVTVLAGETSGNLPAAVPGIFVIRCMTPNVDPNIFRYGVLCSGTNYVFDLIIDTPC